MQPAATRPEPSGGGSLRRWGPIVAIVAVIAIVAGLVVLGGGDDDDDDADGRPTATATTDRAAATPPEGADHLRRRPRRPAPRRLHVEETLRHRDRPASRSRTCSRPSATPTSSDNGGATAHGVTADTIKVVVYLGPEQDPVLDFITAPIDSDDTNDAGQGDDTRATSTCSTTCTRPTAARSSSSSCDGVGPCHRRGGGPRRRREGGGRDGRLRRVGRPGPHRRVGEELEARGVRVHRLPRPAPTPTPSGASPSRPSATQNRADHFVEYLQQEAGRQAGRVYAGDEAFQSTERSFGYLYIETDAQDVARRGRGARGRSSTTAGIELAESIAVRARPGHAPGAGGDRHRPAQGRRASPPCSSPATRRPGTFTEEATEQDYFPEWVLGAAGAGRHHRLRPHLRPGAVGARLRPQLARGARVDPAGRRGVPLRVVLRRGPAGRRHRRRDPPQPGHVLRRRSRRPGPNLTTSRSGTACSRRHADAGGVTEPGHHLRRARALDPGLERDDYDGIDDFTEIWWDPDARPRRDPQGGRRHVRATSTVASATSPASGPRSFKVFDEEGTSTIYDELPEGEELPDNPRTRRPPPRADHGPGRSSTGPSQRQT